LTFAGTAGETQTISSISSATYLSKATRPSHHLGVASNIGVISGAVGTGTINNDDTSTLSITTAP